MNRPTPTISALLFRGLTKRCPWCGQGKLFRRWFVLPERCPRCRLRFEREEGAFLGSLAINFGVTGLAFMSVLVTWLALTLPDPPVVAITVTSVLIALLLPLIVYPFAKTTWSAIDILMHGMEREDTAIGSSVASRPAAVGFAVSPPNSSQEVAHVLEVVKQAVEAARRAGADYADARFVAEESESLSVKNQEMEGIDRALSQGVGIRVLVNGYWGFAATARTEDAEIERTAKLAASIARAASRLPMDPVRLVPIEPVTAEWRTPIQEDPFTVPLDEKVSLLMEASRRMQEVKGLAFAEANLDFYRRQTSFATSEGAAIEQTVVNSGGGMEATAISDGEVQRRSFPNSFRGHIRAAGYEHIRTLGLLEEAERVAQEAIDLLSAKECPSEVTTLVLDGNQVVLQMHESVGHPLELDRVLGMEEAFAGTSFVRPEDRGKLRYGSDKITIVADSTLPGGLGTYGFDDEGVPAQRVTLIEKGIFQDFIASRETASIVASPLAAAMRADGWQNLPLIRMTNVNLEPGEGSRAEIIGDTEDGIFMTTNQSWSIDDKRVNFQFGCEAAWRIKDGKLTEMYKNPNYAGITTDFWGSCDAVGGSEEWTVWGTPNCGKGQPGQAARVGHGASLARFRNVQVGVR